MRYARVQCACSFKAEASGVMAMQTAERAARIHGKRCAAPCTISSDVDATARQYLAEVRS